MHKRLTIMHPDHRNSYRAIDIDRFLVTAYYVKDLRPVPFFLLLIDTRHNHFMSSSLIGGRK